MFVCALVFNKNTQIPFGINDSKKLSDKQRRALSFQISTISHYKISSASNLEIDELGINKATELAIFRAIDDLKIAQVVLIDGNMKMDFNIPAYSIIKGDQKSLSIAAASIMAKVARDDYMIKISKEYPEYMWHKNSGYGTKNHIEAIKKYGICKYHRRSFLQKIIQKSEINYKF